MFLKPPAAENAGLPPIPAIKITTHTQTGNALYPLTFNYNLIVLFPFFSYNLLKATNAAIPYYADCCPCRGPEIRIGANVLGVMEQGNFAYGGGAAMDDLKSYIIGRLLWNPDTDIDPEMERFIQAVYGAPAASYTILCNKETPDAMG